MPTIETGPHDLRCPYVATASYDEDTGVIEVVRCDRFGGDGHLVHIHSTALADDGTAGVLTWYQPVWVRSEGWLEWGE